MPSDRAMSRYLRLYLVPSIALQKYCTVVAFEHITLPVLCTCNLTLFKGFHGLIRTLVPVNVVVEVFTTPYCVYSKSPLRNRLRRSTTIVPITLAFSFL